MFVDKERSLCKKCVPEYIESNMRERRQATNQSGEPNTSPDNQMDARMAGIKTMALNVYQTEKTQISRSLDHISKFNRELRYMGDGIMESEAESVKYL